MGGHENRDNNGVEQTDGGAIHRETEPRARNRQGATVHEQPALERHELPGIIPVWEYHEYHHDDRWGRSETPLRRDSIDWLESDEWLVYDVDIREAGPYDLFLRVAEAEGFGESQLGIVIDDDPRQRLRFDATGGWNEWSEIQTVVELPRGLHTVRLGVFDGGWKLGQLRFR